MDDVVIVNEKDEIIGTMPRSEAHANGVLHRVAVTYVENQKNEILVQIRMSGHFDHSSAGHVDSGEAYLQAAERELKEELGISGIQLTLIGHGTSDEMAKSKIVDKETLDHIVHVFDVFVCKAEPGELAPDEVKGIFWSKPEDILKDMQINPDKYAGGFKATIGIYLNWKKNLR